ncbi:MAG: hypothetical protein WDW36_004123 [Sanguina aurantia]
MRRQVQVLCSSIPPAPASASLACPYTTLGVKATADDKEIKRAFRKLALQHHPDVAKGVNAERDFKSITSAYEMLTKRAHGQDADEHGAGDGQTAGWGFHDWYWSFRMQRTWENAAAGPASAGSDEPQARRPVQPGFSREETKQAVRSQLAGLRSRATVRANRACTPAAEQAEGSHKPTTAHPPPSAAAPTPVSAASTQQQQQQPEQRHGPHVTTERQQTTSHHQSSGGKAADIQSQAGPAAAAEVDHTGRQHPKLHPQQRQQQQQRRQQNHQEQQDAVESSYRQRPASPQGARPVQNHAVPFPGRVPFRVVQPFSHTGKADGGRVAHTSPHGSPSIDAHHEEPITGSFSHRLDPQLTSRGHADSHHSTTASPHTAASSHLTAPQQGSADPTPHPIWRLGAIPRVFKRFLTVIGVTRLTDRHQQQHHDHTSHDTPTHPNSRVSHAGPLLHELDGHSRLEHSMPSRSTRGTRTTHQQVTHNHLEHITHHHRGSDVSTVEANSHSSSSSRDGPRVVTIDSHSGGDGAHSSGSDDASPVLGTAAAHPTAPQHRPPSSHALTSMDLHHSGEQARREAEDEAEARRAEEEPFSRPGANAPRRKFVANSDSRADLSHQLAGLKRKAAIKQSRASQPCA